MDVVNVSLSVTIYKMREVGQVKHSWLGMDAHRLQIKCYLQHGMPIAGCVAKPRQTLDAK